MQDRYHKLDVIKNIWFVSFGTAAFEFISAMLLSIPYKKYYLMDPI